MKRNASYFHRDEKFKKSHSENSENSDLRLRRPVQEDEQLQRRRKEWFIQQKREREHEKLKKKKILEYESQRKKELAKTNKTESRSLESQNRNNASTANTSTALTLSEKYVLNNF